MTELSLSKDKIHILLLAVETFRSAGY